ncbi:amine sulfotransferase-like isoform X1 [Chiloscyllium punctatum]|uniref:amine sulfotransferase-like isoform X1 n=2 Tax=Chiloscyllium punctatum TaxID=137246 RepID=UPI003B63BE4C
MDNDEASNQPFEYFELNGISFASPLHSLELLEWLKDFEMDPDIPLIVSYPKSGTNWVQQMASLILANGNIDSVKDKILKHRAPWIEFVPFKPGYTDYQLLTTHLNYQMVPSSAKNRRMKIIYVARNPKDVVVSFYHYHNCHHYLKTPKDFSDFLEQFIEGNVIYGSWFDHIRDWYNHKDELNMLFVTYEDMQKDIRSVIVKVASFLNKMLDGKTLESIVDHCTFAYMKTNAATNYRAELKHFNHDIGHFFRKGLELSLLGNCICVDYKNWDMNTFGHYWVAKDLSCDCLELQ